MALTEPTTAATAATDRAVDDEVVVAARDLSSRQAFDALVRRLSDQSVAKHYDAYADIPWDDPEYAVDPDDPRWELPPIDGLGATAWYRSQPPGVRSRIGMHRIVTAAKLGLQFENILKRGLLEYAFSLPNDDPRFRYVYHEVIEEAHHGLMFQELVNRSGMDVKGLPWHLKLGSQAVVALGRLFPELFFIFVLGGEDPIDHVQRETLRSDRELPPIVEIIMRHHVTEEARHLSFARHYLKTEVPKLSWWRKQVLAIGAPIILGIMASLMLAPPRSLQREFGLEPDVLAGAYRGDGGRQEVKRSVRKVRALCRELGLINPVSRRIWIRFGIYSRDAA